MLMLEVQCALYVIDQIAKGGKRFDNDRQGFRNFIFEKMCPFGANFVVILQLEAASGLTVTRGK